jgi:hypothetical protein
MLGIGPSAFTRYGATPPAPPTNVLAGLTPTLTVPAGGISPSAGEFGGTSYLSTNVVLSGTAILPLSPPDGTLFKLGGNMICAYLGVRDHGATFRVRTGDGGLAYSASSFDTVILDIPISSLPFDGKPHVITWDFRVTPGRARLWIDNVFRGENFTTGGGGLKSGTWSGGGNGQWLIGGRSNINGEPTADWPTTVGASGLTLYADQLVSF